MATRIVRLTDAERKRMIEEYGKEIEERDFKGIRIYADGGCSGNPGPGGYGAVLIKQDGEVKEVSGSEHFTTNQKMELTAVIEALRTLNLSKPTPLMIVSDSQYVINGCMKWMWTWAKFNWKKAGGGKVQNQDLWEKLYTLVKPHYEHLRCLWKKGHNGHTELERCHALAQRGTHSYNDGFIEE